MAGIDEPTLEELKQRYEALDQPTKEKGVTHRTWANREWVKHNPETDYLCDTCSTDAKKVYHRTKS